MPTPQTRTSSSSSGSKTRTLQPNRNPCCAIDFLKSSLFFFHIVFLLSAATLLALGTYAMVEKNDYAPLLSHWCNLAIYLLLVAGAFAAGTALLGCYGIIQESRIALAVLAGLLTVVLVLELIAGASAYVAQDQLKDELYKQLRSRMLEGWNKDKATTHAIDSLQQRFQCCGAWSYTEWKDSIYVQRLNVSTPDSCCKTMVQYCGVSDHPSNIYREGCVARLFNNVHSNYVIIGAVCLGFWIMEIFGIVLSCSLSRQVWYAHKNRRRLLLR